MKREQKSVQTRQEITASFEGCMDEKPLDKITIIDITERSGVSRQMFYHYFSDRVELVRWVCSRYVRGPLYEKDMFVWEEAMQRLLSSKQTLGQRYRNILHSRYAKILEDMLVDETYMLYYCMIRYRICRTLPNELTDILHQYCADSAHRILTYMEDADNMDAALCIRQLYDAMPKQLGMLICERGVSVKDIFAERRLLNWAYE